MRSWPGAALKAASACLHSQSELRIGAVNAATQNINIKLGALKKRSEFLYVRDGFYSAKGGVVVQMRKNKARAGMGVGFTATKKIGNAVTRNRAKRRLREAGRALLPEFGLPGHDYVLIARNSTTARNWTDLLDDTRKALITLSKRAADTTATPARTPNAKQPTRLTQK